MTDNKKYNVAAIGNAMLDVLCEVPEPFLDHEGISKGVMNLVSRERSNNILKLVKPIKETAGGSAANTISTLAKLGLRTGYIGKIADDQKGRVFKKDLIRDSIIYKTAFLDKSNSESTGKCIVLITPDKEIVENSNPLNPAYIIFNNYELILKWNRSLRFGLAVCTLKNKFKNAL